MNRNKADQMPTLQIQFLQNICLPLYNVCINHLGLFNPYSFRVLIYFCRLFFHEI